MTVFKHYYSDEGGLNYEPLREHIVKFAHVIDPTQIHEMKTQWEITNIAYDLMYHCDIHLSLGNKGIGGCKTLDQWKEIKEENPLRNLLKEMLIHFTEQGFLHKEFFLVVKAAIATIAMEFMLHRCGEG